MLKMVFSLILLVTFSARAGACEGFEAVFKDEANGLSWSKPLEGRYTNLSANSEAAKACRDIDSRLPTKEEIESLIRKFPFTEEKDYGPRLTSQGETQMRSVFGDSHAFWSSSAPSDYPDFAFAMGAFGYVDTLNRHFEFSVRCVSER